MKTKIACALIIVSITALAGVTDFLLPPNWEASANYVVPAPTPRTISRTCTVSNQLYVVIYEYTPEGVVAVPATYPAGQPHYACKTTVYKAVQLGKTFDGQVTENGCFEDKAEDMVLRAMK